MGKAASKPSYLRALEGNRSNSLPKGEDAAAREPKPDLVCPDAPKELSTKAKKIWNKLAPRLHKLKLLTELDEDALFILCSDLATIRNAVENINLYRKQIAKLRGQLVRSGADQKILDEALKNLPVFEMLYNRLSKNYMKHAKEFGLTPRGRVGLVVGGDALNGGAGADLLT